MDYVEAAAERIALYELHRDDRRRAATSPTCCMRAARAGASGACAGCATLKNAAGDRSSSASRSTGSRTRPTRSCARRGAACSSEEKDPIAVIKWKEIYENLENATDRCEDVANIIEGVVLEHA